MVILIVAAQQVLTIEYDASYAKCPDEDKRVILILYELIRYEFLVVPCIGSEQSIWAVPTPQNDRNCN